MSRKFLIAVPLASMVLLAACGGSDKEVVSNTTTTYVPQNEQQPKPDGNPQP